MYHFETIPFPEAPQIPFVMPPRPIASEEFERLKERCTSAGAIIGAFGGFASSCALISSITNHLLPGLAASAVATCCNLPIIAISAITGSYIGGNIAVDLLNRCVYSERNHD